MQYWSESWQQIVLDYLDRIIDDGFDGVYLDIIDAYEYWADEDNGEGILDYDTGNYLRTINGIGIEDLLYWETEKIDPEVTAYRKDYINRITAAGKTVLSVDYVDNGSYTGANRDRIADFTARAEADGYIPFAAAADRKLASIP